MNISGILAVQKSASADNCPQNTVCEDKPGIFTEANSQLLFFENALAEKEIEISILESNRKSLQNTLGVMRSEEIALGTTNALIETSIVENETKLRQDVQVTSIERNIRKNQEQIAESQEKLQKTGSSFGVILYIQYSKEIRSLQSQESMLVRLIKDGTANGTDVSPLESRLQKVRKDIEKLEEERQKFKPEYDEFANQQQHLENLVTETDELFARRDSVAPELTLINQMSLFLDAPFMKSESNMDTDISEYECKLSDIDNKHDTKTKEKITIQSELESFNYTLIKLS